MERASLYEKADYNISPALRPMRGRKAENPGDRLKLKVF
jgi:hypothetical protein